MNAIINYIARFTGGLAPLHAAIIISLSSSLALEVYASDSELSASGEESSSEESSVEETVEQMLLQYWDFNAVPLGNRNLHDDSHYFLAKKMGFDGRSPEHFLVSFAIKFPTLPPITGFIDEDGQKIIINWQKVAELRDEMGTRYDEESDEIDEESTDSN